MLSTKEISVSDETVITKSSAEDFDFSSYSHAVIKPFVHGEGSLGLDKYGLVVFPNTHQTEPIGCVEQGGSIRYLTGLDEFAPSVLSIKDKKAKEARILQIRKTVAYVENVLNSNKLDVEDDMFWSKVQTLRPDNSKFWEGEDLRLELSNREIRLDPENNIMHLLLIHAIEAGGFSIVAKDWEDARRRRGSGNPPKFYLDREHLSVRTKISGKRLINKATTLLDELYDNDRDKLMLVCKVVDTYGHHYQYSTHLDVMYDAMDKWIRGEGIEKSKSKAAKLFIDACALDAKSLKLKALCKDAGFYKIIAAKTDGILYHMKSGSPVGRNMNEAAEFFGDPTNQDILGSLIKEVEKYWKA